MSEPEPDDDASRSDLPWWWLRASGLAMLVLAFGLRAVFADGPMALVSWGLGMLGAAIALFGADSGKTIASGLRQRQAETTAIDPAARQPLRILAIGSAAIAVIGIGWVLSDVDEQVQATDAWWVVVAGAAGLIAAAIWRATLEQASTSLRVEPPESEKQRRLIALAVALALVAEIAIPATYYFGDDRFDERFAWRMFSDVRVYRCRLSAYDVLDGRRAPVSLPATIHVAWINTMRRSREGVLQRYLTWRCDNAAIDGAQIVNECVTPENQPVPPLVRGIECGSGHITGLDVE